MLTNMYAILYQRQGGYCNPDSVAPGHPDQQISNSHPTVVAFDETGYGYYKYKQQEAFVKFLWEAAGGDLDWPNNEPDGGWILSTLFYRRKTAQELEYNFFGIRSSYP